VQLELLAARLRHRSSYEATDLGLALLRRFAGPTYVAWFAVTAPLHLALILSLEPGWACLAAWWLRPAFDLVVLFVLSRALFGAVPDLRAVFATLPALAPIALHRVTWKRLDPLRAYASPAEMLEGLRGAALGKRLAFLRSKAGGGELGLIFLASSIELAIWLGLSVFALMLVPESWLDLQPVIIESMQEPLYLPEATWLGYATFALQFVATSIIEPVFVAAGFGQYLNRRTQTEAWDLELGLRRLAARVGSLRAPLATLLVLGAVSAGRVTGQEPSPPAEPPDPKTTITAVLAEPEFRTTRARRSAAPRGGGSLGGLAGLGDLVAIGVVVAFAGAVLWFALQRRQAVPADTKQPRAGRPRTVAGFDLDGHQLPADVPTAAAALFAAGDARAGLGLLYRAALVQMVDGWHLAIRESATEGDCQRAAATIPAAPRSYFDALTAAWVQVAYGHTSPETGQCSALCRDWTTIVAPRRAKAESP
jgi:hypothetical protein